MSEMVFFPSLDGNVGRSVADTSWANIRNGDGTSAEITNTAQVIGQLYSGESSGFVTLSRGIVLFDLTQDQYGNPLPSNAVISAVILSIYGQAKYNTWSGVSFAGNVFSSNPASNNALVLADYGALGITPFASEISYDNWIVDSPYWNYFIFNATGIVAVQTALSGDKIVRLGLRESLHDVPNSDPDHLEAYKNFYMLGFSTEGGASYKPKLVITYTRVSVQTDAATNITQNAAQLNGTLTNTNAEVAYVSFDWGLTTNYGNSTLEEAKLSSGTFNKNIGNNLTPDTTYHFRAKARVGTSYVYGSNRTLRTGTPSTTADTPIRVTGIVHLWSAGPEATYKAEVYTGGLQSSYLPPISDKEPLPSITPSAAESLKRLGMLRTGTAMSQTNALFQYGVWLSQHTQAQINAIFHHAPTFAEWFAWYRVNGQGAL